MDDFTSSPKTKSKYSQGLKWEVMLVEVVEHGKMKNLHLHFVYIL